MYRSTLKTTRSDIRSRVKDAQELFREAAATTGETAKNLREEGLELLDVAVPKAQDVQAAAIETSKEIAATTDARNCHFGRHRFAGRLGHLP